jgi:hypothetical protein
MASAITEITEIAQAASEVIIAPALIESRDPIS